MKFTPPCLTAFSTLLLAASPALAEERTYDLADFDRIEISAGVKLVADIGDAQAISVETENGDFRDFKIKVSNGELSLSREWNRLSWRGKKADYKVTLTVPELTAIEASSGSHAIISNVDTRRFEMDLSSGAYVVVDGECQTCTLDLSSGANLDGRDLECAHARIDVSSGGHGKLYVSESVVGDASSGGHVAVYGNPQQLNIEKSSGGRIKVIATAQATRD